MTATDYGANYAVELDLDEDGVFETDIYAYVEDIQTTTGRDRPSQLTGKASPGSLSATLLNDDDRFSDFNVSSPYYGVLLPGKKIRFRDNSIPLRDVETIIRDRFRRVNGALGTAEIGGAWAETEWKFHIDSRRAVPAAGDEIANNLPISTTSLVGYWPLQEATGTRYDQTANDNDLAPAGTPNPTGSSGPGMAFPKSTVFTGSARLSIADNTPLSVQDIDFTIAGWFKLSSKTATGVSLGKWTGSDLSYNIRYDQATDRWRFGVSADGVNAVWVSASTFGSPTTDRWVFIVAWHDATANTINISVNNGTVDSTAHSTGVFDGTAAFTVGAESDGTTNPYRGSVAGLMIFKRVLTAAEITSLFNGSPYMAILDGGNTTGDLYTNDVFIQATIEPGSIGIGGTLPSHFDTKAGFVFRYTDDLNYSYACFDSTQSVASIHEVIAGVDTTLASQNLTFGSLMTLGLLTVGNFATLYFEGVPHIRQRLTDNLTADGVGLYATIAEDASPPFITDIRVWNHMPSQRGFSANLLINGDFEQDVAWWIPQGTDTTINQSNAWAYTGIYSARVTAAASNAFGLRYNLPLTGNTSRVRYTISARIRVATAQAVIGKIPFIMFHESGGVTAERTHVKTFAALVAGVQYVEHSFEVSETDRTQLGIDIQIALGVSGDEFFIDDIQVKIQNGVLEGVFWTGSLDEIKPEVGQRATHRATLKASGPLAQLARMDVTPMIGVGHGHTGELVGGVLARAGMLHPPGYIEHGNIITGTFVRERGNALAIARDIEEVELGFIHESQEGEIVFRSRTHRDTNTEPVAGFSDDPFGEQLNYSGINQESWIGDIYNQVEAGVSPYGVGAAATLFTDANMYVLQAGQSIDMVASYQEGTGIVARWTGHTRDVSVPLTPTHASHTTQTVSIANTSHPVTMPATVNAGDLLLIFYHQRPISNTNTPTGWTKLYDSGFGRVLYGKVAVGDEDSTVVNIISESGPNNSIAHCVRVTNFDNVAGFDAIKIGGASGGTSRYPNPYSVAWDWGPIPTLVYAISSPFDNYNSTPPTGMTEVVDTALDGNVADLGQSLARIDLVDVEMYEPGDFTLANSTQWEARTIAIRGLATPTQYSHPTPQGSFGNFSVNYLPSFGGTYQIHQNIEAIGDPITKVDDISVRVDDYPSQDTYGIIPYRNAANLFRSTGDAQGYVDLVLEQYKNRHPIITMTFTASQAGEYYAQAKLRRVGDRIQLVANGDLGSGLGIAQDFWIETIHHHVTRGIHEVTYELSPAATDVLAQGVVQPIIIHFGLSGAPLTRLVNGYTAALQAAQAYFASQLAGREFDFDPVVTIDATAQGRSINAFLANLWSEAIACATQGGWDAWTDYQMICTLVDDTPHTVGNGGGASPTGLTGQVVKDGDALETFAKWHVDEAGVTEAEYQANLGMLIHELLHGFHANAHEDVAGQNVEWEWYYGIDTFIASVNKSKLISGIWVA